ncbi:ATP-dependent DNA helicase [Candidatus Methylospira mobilis]|uniref:DNA 5'-3' helicase n=1 Tax=Candidatus Methylospira mobilis TaxID=1808979 RepID=A0A5Q0BMD8_9GAMM|nr:ATP-dependent DNA helicase [Candidatus Methylospira mobilis]QFY43267.1 ATP-dependent DNA helicase [Candidatus Methylospira mobilis]WNV03530.1 ATP-dependent DNA helicase [Candidatus Methylospira mobilis]
MISLSQVFSPDGLLAAKVERYRLRQPQLEMAEAVAEAIKSRKTLVAEAGTGTGKTLAYLVPAILSGRRVIVSTGTRNLQDQLFHKDVPLLRQVLGVPFSAALLKGRSNYLCPYRLYNLSVFRHDDLRSQVGAIEAIKRWGATTRRGDIAEMESVAESSVIWPWVTSTADNCLGQECPQLSDCFLLKARKAAQEAEILVINHHLLWADWAIRSDGFGELLPEADVVIIDEAHQFAETASQFLGLILSSRQLTELCHDALAEQLKDACGDRELGQAIDRVELAVSELRLSMGVEPMKAAWTEFSANAEAMQRLEELQTRLSELSALLRAAAICGKGLESCWKRCDDILALLAEFQIENKGGSVRWFETFRRGFVFNRTPLDTVEEFAKFQRSSKASWIFTSATLSVSGRFEHFTQTLGLFDAEARSWDSPFSYPEQCIFYLPLELPEPSAPDHADAVINAAVPVLQASGGRTFFLFTSHAAMQNAAARLKELVEYPLFVQGTQPKARLLESFRQAGNGILLGTSSFWEGVDVRGPALSCVIIDKLPFAAPGDPVLNAKLDALKQKGLSPFGAHQLPAAVIALRQGVGRLIRSSDDRGVFMLCDPRVISKSYGKVFLNSLPPMRRTRSLPLVRRFFAAEETLEGKA